MRSVPTLSERRFRLSFFLTTPAKKPRIECCCQLVAFMIAAIVAPFGRRSILTTVSCFDEDSVDLNDPAFLVAVFDGVRLRFADRAGSFWAMLLADFDLSFLVAIWPSLMSDSIKCCH